MSAGSSGERFTAEVSAGQKKLFSAFVFMIPWLARATSTVADRSSPSFTCFSIRSILQWMFSELGKESQPAGSGALGQDPEVGLGKARGVAQHICQVLDVAL